MRRVAAIACSLVASVASLASFAQKPSPAEPAASAVDKLFAQWNRPDSPGCSIGVSRHGAVVYERGYGMANLELGVPITPASVFHVASISKQFTAMSIMLLAQRGRLSLDDEARKYVPELPAYGSRLTIRHLLAHTSGLRDAYLLVELAAPRESRDDRNEELVKVLARQRALNFTPGAEFQYNNGGYVMLGSIVKRVSGESLRAFADANIFTPLGMAHTHFQDDPTALVPNRVSGYHRDDGALHQVIQSDRRPSLGNSGVLTTAGDLLRWEHNFADLRVGDRTVITTMETPPVLADGSKSPYGLGLEVAAHRGVRTIGHGGGDRGYVSQVVRYPDHGLAIAVLCNMDEISPATLAQRVAEIYLPDAFVPPASDGSALAPVAVAASELASKAGLYRDATNEAWGDLLEIVVRDGTLIAIVGSGDRFELTPVSANGFVLAGTPITVRFVPAAAGRPQELQVTGARAKTDVLQQLAPFTPTATELAAFAGTYESTELDVTYSITTRAPGLVIRMPGRPDVVLRPIFKDGFDGFNVVKFSRDARGRVTGFTINATGVRSLRFARVTR